MRKLLLLLFILAATQLMGQETTWIRINQLGYPTHTSKTAVWCSKQAVCATTFELVDAASNKVVYRSKASAAFGAYGPFLQSCRLDFSAFTKPGRYFLRTGQTTSPVFPISDTVYKGTADFCLRYMRQQRSGFNPYLKDSCHTHDGYTLYGPMPDSTHVDATGGWHDASDYLQYSTTSANATYHLLAAYRDFTYLFMDRKQGNGLDGKNGTPDILDEAKWGLDWLLKMHPKDDWMFNQLGDDRDHINMRMPKEDPYYGKGFERSLYFNSGGLQQRGKFMNASTGTSSTAAKFTSAFALGSMMFETRDTAYSALLKYKAKTAWNFALSKPGVMQTASVKSPYIYAEDNWVDDMELAAVSMYEITDNDRVRDTAKITLAMNYAKQEPLTPWLGTDTAKHYQWYPFINLGHNELAQWLRLGNEIVRMTNKIGKIPKQPLDTREDTIINYYRQGIEKVWNKAKHNAFYRGIPFIWCSNNLTTSFAIQCYWYENLSRDTTYNKLQQANIDWLFGCNPWGTSMVYGLPANGDTPVDPHSAFTHLKNYPIDGGLVDGPVYTAIYKGLIGIKLNEADEYAEFQSDLAVYHDDYGDYSTNEPTMDGTASLIYLLAANEASARWKGLKWTMAAPTFYQTSQNAIIRGDSVKKEIALVFTGDEFGDGLSTIANTLEKQKVNGSFFFTGRFYRNKEFQPLITKLYQQKNLMGSHSDQHLLYCDWTKRDSMLVTKDSLFKDFYHSQDAMLEAGINDEDISKYFIPPYEWWNSKVGKWMDSAGIKLFSFTPGTTSNADYTYPELGRSYRTSDAIMQSIKKFGERPGGLNGVVLLIHAGTDPRRKDKLYDKLDELIVYLKSKGYSFKKADELLK